jgi:peptidoglycan hydrolase-like protein with peptidoglycan-binding domain
MVCVAPPVQRTAPGWARSAMWGVVMAIALSPLPILAQTPADDPTPVGQPAVPTVSGGRIVRPTLQLGNQGESVRELQSMLILLGYYPGPVTGVYAEDTVAAARRFQTAAGITADGIVGPATWSRLFPTPPGEANPPTATTPPATGSATPPTTSSTTRPATGSTTPPTTGNTAPPSTASPSSPPASPSSSAVLPVLRPGMEGDAVRQLQQRLRTKGFYNGPIDGLFGAQTEAAVRRAQSANNLTVDGIVGPATWRALN